MFVQINFPEGLHPKGIRCCSYIILDIQDKKEMDNVVRRWRKDFKLERIKTDKKGNRLYRAVSAVHLEENTAEKKKCWECKYSYQDFTWEYQCTLEKEYPNGKEINGDSDACEHFA